MEASYLPNPGGLTQESGIKYGFPVLAQDGNLYAPPNNNDYILAVDTATGNVSTLKPFGNVIDATFSNAYFGWAECDDGRLIATPSASSHLLLYTPGQASGSGLDMQAAAVNCITSPPNGCYLPPVLAPNKKLYAIPFDAWYVLVVVPVPGNATWYEIEGPYPDGYVTTMAGKFGQNGVLHGSKIYAMPNTNSFILIVDTTDDSLAKVSNYNVAGAWKYYGGGVLAPNYNIYAVPLQQQQILVINTTTDSASFLPNFNLPNKNNNYGSAVAVTPSGKLYALPYFHQKILVINSNDNTHYFLSYTSSTPDKFLAPPVLFLGKLYAVPYTAATVLVIDTTNDSFEDLIGFSDASVGKHTKALLTIDLESSDEDTAIYSTPYQGPAVLRIAPIRTLYEPITEVPTVTPTELPSTASPTAGPTKAPSTAPSKSPTTRSPSKAPTDSQEPTTSNTTAPSVSPTTRLSSSAPTPAPSATPTISPTFTSRPTKAPSKAPTDSQEPTTSNTIAPTVSPSSSAPTPAPSATPTISPTFTSRPTKAPSSSSRPTGGPTKAPTKISVTTVITAPTEPTNSTSTTQGERPALPPRTLSPPRRPLHAASPIRAQLVLRAHPPAVEIPVANSGGGGTGGGGAIIVEIPNAVVPQDTIGTIEVSTKPCDRRCEVGEGAGGGSGGGIIGGVKGGEDDTDDSLGEIGSDIISIDVYLNGTVVTDPTKTSRTPCTE